MNVQHTLLEMLEKFNQLHWSKVIGCPFLLLALMIKASKKRGSQ